MARRMPLARCSSPYRLGDYRFRADLNGIQFWSGDDLSLLAARVRSGRNRRELPVAVTVTDTDAVPQDGLPVYAFYGAAYTGYNGVTDASGEVVFTLPQGDYRFRSDRNGTQFWSGGTDHCALPGCTEASVTVTIPVTVTVQSETGSAYPDLPVYAFDGESYTGFHGASDENGQASFTLPQGTTASGPTMTACSSGAVGPTTARSRAAWRLW